MTRTTPWLLSMCLCALALGLAVSSAMCVVRADAPTVEPPIGPTAESTIEAELARDLDARGLTDDAFVATTVYSWTTEAQAAELARTRRLLTRGAADGVSRSPYQYALDAIAVDAAAPPSDVALAHLLTASPELGARRYAWVTPHGTAIPRGQRSYGPVLLAVTLTDDAVFARFAPNERPAFHLTDREGRAIDPALVVASPARLASVVHVRADDPRGGYREIVVHGAVRCWSMGTAALSDRIDADRAMVSRLRRIARPRRALPLAPFWSARAPIDDVRRWTARWARTMPFDSSRHRLTPTVLTELERLLASRVHQRATPTEVCASP